MNVKNNMVANISKWKSEILYKVAMDDELSKLLKYNKPEALSMPSLSTDERLALVNKNIYGYRFIPDVAETVGSYISLSTSRFVPQEGFRQFSDDYLMGFIYFYILVDNSVMEMETGYRQDLIADRIYSIFQSNTEFGMGELRLESFIENWEHHNKFGGYIIGFRTIDFK